MVLCVPLLTPMCAGASTPPSVTTTYRPATSFDPKRAAVNGSTDVYHCTLVDPHLSTERYLTSSQLLVDKAREVHHAIYFLISPAQVARAQALNRGGKGWTCFGDPLNTTGSFGGSAWLGAWAPGGKLKRAPAGTAIPMPKGSEVVVQIHYNLLRGSRPDRTAVRLTTVAPTAALQPMSIVQLPAPPDLPCAAGVSGPLCDRAASLADLGRRFGPAAVAFVDRLESFCHHDVANLVTIGRDVLTACTVPLPAGIDIRQATIHMHLLGQSGAIDIVRGASTIAVASVAHYNFDNQQTYTPGSGVITQPGDQLRLTCTYAPWLRPKLAETKKLMPRYVTWGDGSSDEMCLAILSVTRA